MSLQTPSLAQFSSALFLTTAHATLKSWRRTLPGSNELTAMSLLWSFPSSVSIHSPSFSPQQLQPGLLKLCDTLLLFFSKPSGGFHLSGRICQIFVLAYQAPWPPPQLMSATIQLPSSSHLASCLSHPMKSERSASLFLPIAFSCLVLTRSSGLYLSPLSPASFLSCNQLLFTQIPAYDVIFS